MMIRTAAWGLLAMIATLRPQAVPSSVRLADAHVHLSLSSAGALERLADAGVVVVRDCGGDLEQLTRWRDDVSAGRRRGPKIFVSGPLLDGPKEGAQFR